MHEPRRSFEAPALAEQAAALLQRSDDDRQLSDVLRNVDLASVVLDREGRITFCSDYFLRLTGWQGEDLIGRDYFECFVRGDPDDRQRRFATIMAEGPEKWQFEREVFTRTGKRLLMRWSGLILRRADGAASGVASIGEDVTEREQAQARK